MREKGIANRPALTKSVPGRGATVRLCWVVYDENCSSASMFSEIGLLDIFVLQCLGSFVPRYACFNVGGDSF